MAEIECYYIVVARTAFFNPETDELEFRARERKFSDHLQEKQHLIFVMNLYMEF